MTDPKCSFCGRFSSMVGKLISGPTEMVPQIYICDGCVDICSELLDEEFMTATDRLLWEIRAKRSVKNERKEK